jgi:hypothetical protein
MTTQRDLERALDDFFAAGVEEVADRVIDDALMTIDHTPQRRVMRVPWRFPFMSSSLKLATTAVAVVLAVGALSAFVLANRGGGSGTTPAPSASAAPAVTPSPSPQPSPSGAPAPSASPLSTVGWLPFTSSHYKYTIAYPPTWAATQATRVWDVATNPLAAPAPGGALDVFLGDANGLQTAVFGFATDVPTGTSEDAWLASYYAGRNFCPTMPTFVAITVDGHPGKLDPCYDAQAFVFVGNRVYVYVIFQQQEQLLFKAFLSTVRFPTSPPSGSPHPSASPS